MVKSKTHRLKTSLEVTLWEVKTYRECPAQYKYRYIDKLEPEFVPAYEWSHQVLNFLFARYIYRKLGNIKDQLSRMQTLFNKVWKSGDIPPGPEELATQVKIQSLAALFNFWNSFSDFFASEPDGKSFILPNLPFNKPRPEFVIDGHLIKGNIDAVYYTAFGANIVRWVFFEPYSDYIDVDYEVLLFEYAFFKKLNRRPINVLLYYLSDGSLISYKGSKSWKVQHFYSPILKAMASQLYYARPGLHCRRCPYQKHCMITNGIDVQGSLSKGRRRRPINPLNHKTALTDIRRALEN